LKYWLDGIYDCFCSLTSSQLICVEAVAHYDYFACGDGQFLVDHGMQHFNVTIIEI
jgi:hypothetical protein